MKLVYKLSYIFVLNIILSPTIVSANRTISAASYTANTRINQPAVVSRDSVNYQRSTSKRYSDNVTKPQSYTENECKTKYIQALDMECYDAANVHSGGLYSNCNDKTVTEFYDIMDMQLAKIIGTTDFIRYKADCDPYKGAALQAWIPTKDIQEKSALKNSSQCQLANKRLTAAKKCYSAAIAHNGNSYEFENLMKATCGDYADVATQFAKAGDLGLSNIPQLITNYATLQFTNKSENWRQSVEAILAGYTYDARQACGEETYDLLQLNEFTQDQRTNLLTVASSNYSNQFNNTIAGRMTAPVVSTAVGSSVNSIPVWGYQNGSVVNTATNGFVTNNNSQNNYYGSNVSTLNNIIVTDVYTIRDVGSIDAAKVKLNTVLFTGNINSYSQDTTDRAIAQGLAGLPTYNTGSNLQAGNAFVIKQTNRVCQVLIVDKNGSLITVAEQAAASDSKLRNYIMDCERLMQ